MKPAEIALALQAIARALEAAVLVLDDLTERLLAAERAAAKKELKR